MNSEEVTKIALSDINTLKHYLMEGLHASSSDEIEIHFSEGKAIIALPSANKTEIIRQVMGKIPLSDPFMQNVLHTRKNEEDRDV